MEKKNAADFAMWLIANYYNTYGKPQTFRARQSYPGSMVDPTEYSIHELADKYFGKQ